jgi:hypothetical protein
MAQQPSGSYAPLDGAKMYPHGMADHQLAKQMSKSASVGAALFLPDGEGLAHAESTNGKQMRMVNGTTMHEHSGTDGPLAGPSSGTRLLCPYGGIKLPVLQLCFWLINPH